MLIRGTLEFGGDEVAKIYFTNGDKQSVNAGQGGSIAVGGQFQFPKEQRLLLRASVGFKYVTTQADNAHIRLTRVPLQVTGNWKITDKILIGAGLVTHQNIRFKADGIGQNFNLKSNVGPIFEIVYKGFGLIYTILNYKDPSNITYNANSIGVSFTGTIQNFGKKKPENINVIVPK